MMVAMVLQCLLSPLLQYGAGYLVEFLFIDELICSLLLLFYNEYYLSNKFFYAIAYIAYLYINPNK